MERRINAVTYVVKRSPNGKSFTVHVDKLKPFTGTVSPIWMKYLEVKIDDSGSVSSQVAGPVTVDVYDSSAKPSTVSNQLAGPVSANHLVGPVAANMGNQSTETVASEAGVANTLSGQLGAAGPLDQPPGLLSEEEAANRTRRPLLTYTWKRQSWCPPQRQLLQSMYFPWE